MKLSETPLDVQAARRSYIQARWTQLSDVETSYGEEAVKYLLLVNTAAMGATLAFLGAMAHLRPLLWPRTVLLLFAFGVAILGIYHAFRYHRIEWIYKGWRDDAERYTSNEIHWNDLIDADERRVQKLSVLQLALAYLSLLSFFIGLIVAGINFGDIASERKRSSERTETTIDTASDSTKPKAGAAAHPTLDSRPAAGKIGRP